MVGRNKNVCAIETGNMSRKGKVREGEEFREKRKRKNDPHINDATTKKFVVCVWLWVYQI